MTVERKGFMYRELKGDVRWKLDKEAYEKARKSIPNYWEDPCPNCGNAENISGCRCIINHRTCPECGTGWYWEVKRWAGVVECVIGGHGR